MFNKKYSSEAIGTIPMKTNNILSMYKKTKFKSMLNYPVKNTKGKKCVHANILQGHLGEAKDKG